MGKEHTHTIHMEGNVQNSCPVCIEALPVPYLPAPVRLAANSS